jgi:hypothetical protein
MEEIIQSNQKLKCSNDSEAHQKDKGQKKKAVKVRIW